MDNDYIYILEEYVEYYLRVLNREDYQEVYGRVVKK